jgi:Zn-dependent M28 family amino/carboxypeptidase
LAEKTPVIVSAQTRFIPDAWGANAIGTIPGKTEEEIFLVAHLDSQYNAPGAHDNAASVIVMVMLAHALARSQPQKTLRFVATGAEEVGCLGAAHYAERREKEKNLSRVKFCFNFDSLTYGPNLHFSVMDEELKQLVLAAHKDLGMQSKSQALEIKGFSMDDAPFWRAGARTIHFNSRGIEANLGYWHRPDDTPDKVDFKIADAAFRVLLEFIRRVDRL